jgi:hypothetical protein
MRFMMIVKGDETTEAGVMPDEKALADMAKYNEELVNAGVMLSGDGLHPSSHGARIAYSGDKRTVKDGPFAEAKELIAGFWIIQVPNKEAAIEWAKKVPFESGEVELRQIFELDEFGESDAVQRHRDLQSRLG